MTQEEYEKLINSSEVFKSLDPATQKAVLTAEGVNRKHYERIFTEEKEAVMAAKREVIERNAEITKEFTDGVKKDRKEYFVESEKSERENEEKEAEDLLNNI